VIFERDVQTEVAQYLVRCFLRGRSPHIGELAGQLGVNPLALSRRFQRVTGRKLGPFLHVQQVLRARRLLRWPAIPLPEVARASGYEHEKTFYRAFRRATGMTPLRFREQATPVLSRPCHCRITCFLEPVSNQIKDTGTSV
jgi:AraC-like DNA-binding protein